MTCTTARDTDGNVTGITCTRTPSPSPTGTHRNAELLAALAAVADELSPAPTARVELIDPAAWAEYGEADVRPCAKGGVHITTQRHPREACPMHVPGTPYPERQPEPTNPDLDLVREVSAEHTRHGCTGKVKAPAFAHGYQAALADVLAAMAEGGTDGAVRWISDNAHDGALHRLARTL